MDDCEDAWYECTRSLVGTSIASTVTSFGEQGGHDGFTPFEEEQLADAHLVNKIVKGIDHSGLHMLGRKRLWLLWYARLLLSERSEFGGLEAYGAKCA